MPRIDSRWRFLSLQAVVLENAALRVVVLPEVGGRIWSIVYKPLDRELLWQNPRIQPRKVGFGSSYDDVWCGGWEDIFPNDAPGSILGEIYPDHGELWTLDWEWSTSFQANAAQVRLACETPISGVCFEKRITLNGDEARLRVAYRMTNPSGEEFPFLWKLHPALRVQPGWRVDLPPGTRVELEPAFAGTLEGAPQRFEWPTVDCGGRMVDLREAPPPSARQLYFLYGTQLAEGWCAVTDPGAKLSCGLTFDPAVLRSCWLFASYGGWRKYEVAVLEPSTSHPMRIEEAIARGEHGVLGAGASIDTEVVFQAQAGLARVAGVGAGGEFHE